MATRRTSSTGSTRAARPGQAAPPSAQGARPTPPANPPEEKAAPRRRAAAVKPDSASGPATGITVSADARRAMIAQAAYLRCERRGFTPGAEVEDWLAAEAEVDALLRAGEGAAPQ